MKGSTGSSDGRIDSRMGEEFPQKCRKNAAKRTTRNSDQDFHSDQFREENQVILALPGSINRGMEAEENFKSQFQSEANVHMTNCMHTSSRR